MCDVGRQGGRMGLRQGRFEDRPQHVANLLGVPEPCGVPVDQIVDGHRGTRRSGRGERLVVAERLVAPCLTWPVQADDQRPELRHPLE
jgi:hypothetical protein